MFESHPARGAWIEIAVQAELSGRPEGRTPQGVRGLKCVAHDFFDRKRGRTPQGVRGLKFCLYAASDDLICRTPQGVRGLKLLGKGG